MKFGEMLMLLSGKGVVITGSGKGIGRATALAMAREGAHVVVNDVDRKLADETVREIEQSGGKAIACYESVSTMQGAEKIIQSCVESYGKIDVLVNNAGILRDRMVFNMTEQEWDDVIAVHLKGTFACTHYASQYMRKQQSGRIINITSRSGLRGNIGQANYAAAKAGILGFTRTVCQELSKYNITVNAVCPRALTDMVESIPEHIRKKKDASWADSGIRRRGLPEEVAPIIVYLASDEAADITGQVIGLGGDKLSLWSHPHEVAEAFMVGGWTVQHLRQLFKTSVGFELQSVGNKD